MVAQRVTRFVAGAAACAALGACGSAAGLGNILGGVLAPQPASVGATVQTVDTRAQQIMLQQSNGQSLGVNYDSRTKVVYQNQLFAVTNLEYGDQVVARIIDQGNNTYYTDSITVTQPVNGSSTSGGSSTSANVQTLQGTVRQVDRSAGWFTIDGGNGVQLTVTLPYRANTNDVNRFNNLRIGDFVRFYGVFVNNNRVELRNFY
jgi:hypothetical protein